MWFAKRASETAPGCKTRLLKIGNPKSPVSFCFLVTTIQKGVCYFEKPRVVSRKDTATFFNQTGNQSLGHPAPSKKQQNTRLADSTHRGFKTCPELAWRPRKDDKAVGSNNHQRRCCVAKTQKMPLWCVVDTLSKDNKDASNTKLRQQMIQTLETLIPNIKSDPKWVLHCPRYTGPGNPSSEAPKSSFEHVTPKTCFGVL